SQVFANLLNNAAKFTEEGGQIWLQAELPRQEHPAEVVVRVRDTGIGIAPAMLPRIFDLFAQADSTLDRSSGGLGIGLTVVTGWLDLRGGGGGGAGGGAGRGGEFVVQLPVAVPPPAPKSPKNPRASQPPSRRILLVDDNADMTQMLACLLKLD